MIDHLGFSVSNYDRSKAFYAKALAPLGYTLIMEVGEAGSGHRAAGFGRGGKPDIWIGEEGGLGGELHVAVTADDRATVDAFYRAEIAAGGRDNGPPGPRPHYHRITTRHSCAIPTATMWRRCATARAEVPVIVNGALREPLKSLVQLTIHRCK